MKKVILFGVFVTATVYVWFKFIYKTINKPFEYATTLIEDEPIGI